MLFGLKEELPLKFVTLFHFANRVEKFGLWPASGGLLGQDYLFVRVMELSLEIKQKKLALKVKKG